MNYHLKKGHIIRIRRGIYYVVPTGTSPEECQADPYLVCSRLTSDAILAYHTAFAKIYVEDLWVDKKYRGQGYGMKLIRALEIHFEPPH